MKSVPLLLLLSILYFFTPWQALALIGLGVLILYSVRNWKSALTFQVNMTAKDSKNDVLLNWTVIPAKHLFKTDLAVFQSATEYHKVYEYKVEGNQISMRLVESTIETPGKPLLYKVREGVVGTSWIDDWYGRRMEMLGVGEVEELKEEVEWHDASQKIRFFILKRTLGHGEFLSSERQRLKRGIANAEAELRRRGIKQDKDGVYVGPDGPDDELVLSLVSDDHLGKYGITNEEFYGSGTLLKILKRF
jgi:hypothetical protein